MYRKGDVTRYKLSFKIKKLNQEAGEKETVTANLVSKERFNLAEEDGSFSVTNSCEKSEVFSGGKKMDMAGFFPAVTLTKDKDGKRQSKSTGGSPQMIKSIRGIDELVKDPDAYFSTKPVKAGDTWEATDTINGKPGEEATTNLTAVKFLGVQTMNRVKVFSLEIKSFGDAPQFLHSQENALYECETGKLVRSVVKVGSLDNFITSEATSVQIKESKNGVK